MNQYAPPNLIHSSQAVRRVMAVGCNVYLSSDTEQNRLLIECLAPLARALLASGMSDGFSCARFDARGPHVMAIFGATATSRAAVASWVESALSAYLARLDAVEALTQADLEARHVACKGGALCSVDAEAGMAKPGTLRMFDVSEKDYPFSLWTGAVEADAIWRARTNLALWAVEQSGTAFKTATAIRWAASLDRAFDAAKMPRSELWGYLIDRRSRDRDFTKRVAAGELKVHDIASAVNKANGATFTRFWNDEPSDMDRELSQLVTHIFADDGRSPHARKELLRNTEYGTFQLLGIPISQVMQLFLFGWTRAVLAESSEVKP